MKFFYLTLALSLTAFAHDRLEVRKGELDEANSVFSKIQFERVSIIDCRSEAENVLKNFQGSYRRLEKIQRDLEALKYLRGVVQDPEKLARLEAISKRLSCMDQRMMKLKISCKRGCKNLNAFTTKFAGLPLFKDEINLCSQILLNDSEYQQSVIVHEVSHLCGTEDYEYFSFPAGTRGVPKQYFQKSAKSRSLDISDRNGDHFEYWARYGFCLPGHNC